MSKPSKTDNLEDALNYQVAYNIIQEQMDSSSFLLEHIAKRILDAVFAEFGPKLKKANLKISKLNPPVGGRVKCVSISMERKNTNS